MSTPHSTAFDRLVTIMDELREKCPWDAKQTIQSLRQMTIEETYELADAITDENWKAIQEELGDLLLHIVFYAKIGKEQNRFSLEEMIHGICDKLVARHPHVYGDPNQDGEKITVRDEEEVKKNWENLKLREGKKSVLGGVPRSLPAMVKAMRLQEKAKQVGFEWDEAGQVLAKIQEETNEFQEALQSGNRQDMEDELGDILFSWVNYARFLQLDPENALERTNKKFIHRFTQMESIALQEGKNLSNMTLAEMDAIWNAIKKQPRDS